jgi:hypothetical protein
MGGQGSTTGCSAISWMQTKSNQNIGHNLAQQVEYYEVI